VQGRLQCHVLLLLFNACRCSCWWQVLLLASTVCLVVLVALVANLDKLGLQVLFAQNAHVLVHHLHISKTSSA
jgi:hypothetical protein